jgi:hypothetical protein
MILNQLLTEATQLFSRSNGEIVLILVAMSILLSLTLLLSLAKARKSAKQLSRLQHDLKVSNASMINIGQQLLSLEKKFNKKSVSEPVNNNLHLLNTLSKDDLKVSREFEVEKSQQASPQTRNFQENNSSANNEESIYDKARYYLASGDSVENIAKKCNLSHAEVSLLKALSKKPADIF